MAAISPKQTIPNNVSTTIVIITVSVFIESVNKYNYFDGISGVDKDWEC